jgi:hypothetical protein
VTKKNVSVPYERKSTFVSSSTVPASKLKIPAILVGGVESCRSLRLGPQQD